MSQRRKRKTTPKHRSPKAKTARPATRFDEHVRMARRIAKKLGKKVARLTGQSRRRKK